MGLTFADIVGLSAETECDPYVFRVGCFQCIRWLTDSPLALANDAPRHPITGCITNEDCTHPEHVWFVQACLWRQDTSTPSLSWGYGGKIAVSRHAATGEVVKKFFVAARDYSEHEVREAFKYKGRRILGPHISVDALWDAAEETESREVMHGPEAESGSDESP